MSKPLDRAEIVAKIIEATKVPPIRMDMTGKEIREAIEATDVEEAPPVEDYDVINRILAVRDFLLWYTEIADGSLILNTGQTADIASVLEEYNEVLHGR